MDGLRERKEYNKHKWEARKSYRADMKELKKESRKVAKKEYPLVLRIIREGCKLATLPLHVVIVASFLWLGWGWALSSGDPPGMCDKIMSAALDGVQAECDEKCNGRKLEWINHTALTCQAMRDKGVSLYKKLADKPILQRCPEIIIRRPVPYRCDLKCFYTPGAQLYILQRGGSNRAKRYSNPLKDYIEKRSAKFDVFKDFSPNCDPDLPRSEVFNNRTYEEYRDGFGCPCIQGADFWIGLETLYRLTNTPEYLWKLVYESASQKIVTTFYDPASTFRVGSGPSYELWLGNRDVNHTTPSDYNELKRSQGRGFSAPGQVFSNQRKDCPLDKLAGWWFHGNCEHIAPLLTAPGTTNGRIYAQPQAPDLSPDGFPIRFKH